MKSTFWLKICTQDIPQLKLSLQLTKNSTKEAHFQFFSSLSPSGRSQHVWAQKVRLLTNFRQRKMHTISSVRHSQEVAQKVSMLFAFCRGKTGRVTSGAIHVGIGI